MNIYYHRELIEDKFYEEAIDVSLKRVTIEDVLVMVIYIDLVVIKACRR